MVESKYLNFVEVEVTGRKTPIYEVKNKSGEYLGYIIFRPSWRKFVFLPAKDTLFDAACLSDIIIQLNDAQVKWKAGLKK